MAEQVKECRNCAELLQRLEMLERKVGCVLAKLAKSEARVRQLQKQLAGAKKDSGNSSKPPSSDIVKPPRKSPLRRRRLGGQEGHAPQQRPPFALNEIDVIEQHAYESCPKCGAPYLIEKTTKKHGRQILCSNEDCDYARSQALPESAA